MIEIGRKYEIVNSWNGNNGVVVTVTGYAGKPEKLGVALCTGDRWFVDMEFQTNCGDIINHMGEKQFKPIYDGDQVIRWESMADLWVPDKSTICA